MERDAHVFANFLWLALAPITIPLLLIAGLLSIPYPVVFAWLVRRREARFHDRLRANGRFLDWSAVTERLKRGEGTFLVEHANKQAGRFWWSADDVAALAPAAPPDEESGDYVVPNPQHPFVSWCFARYTSPDTGLAWLTEPDLDFPAGPITKDFLSSCFPNARLAFTILAYPNA